MLIQLLTEKTIMVFFLLLVYICIYIYEYRTKVKHKHVHVQAYLTQKHSNGGMYSLCLIRQNTFVDKLLHQTVKNVCQGLEVLDKSPAMMLGADKCPTKSLYITVFSSVPTSIKDHSCKLILWEILLRY